MIHQFITNELQPHVWIHYNSMVTGETQTSCLYKHLHSVHNSSKLTNHEFPCEAHRGRGGFTMNAGKAEACHVSSFTLASQNGSEHSGTVMIGYSWSWTYSMCALTKVKVHTHTQCVYNLMCNGLLSATQKIIYSHIRENWPSDESITIPDIEPLHSPCDNVGWKERERRRREGNEGGKEGGRGRKGGEGKREWKRGGRKGKSCRNTTKE